MEIRGGWARTGSILDVLTGSAVEHMGPEAVQTWRLASMRNTTDLIAQVLRLEAKRSEILDRYQQFQRVGPTAELGPNTYAIASNQYELELTLLNGDIRRAELDVEDGSTRDELLAKRPAGCFCLGLGGRGLCLKVGDDPETEGPVWRWSDACGCPEGLAMEIRGRDATARAQAEADEIERAQAAEAAEVLRQARITSSGITPRVLGMTWASHPRADTANASAISWRLQALADPARRLPMSSLDEGRRGVYLSGPVGTGKTCLAQLALLEWINAGHDGKFINLAKWLEALRNSYDRNPGAMAPRDLTNSLTTAPLLVVDDLGTEYLTDWGAEKVFLLVNERYERQLPTIFTANYPLSAMAPRLAGKAAGSHTPDPIRGERIVDRIFETCDQLELSGESLRAEVLA